MRSQRLRKKRPGWGQPAFVAVVGLLGAIAVTSPGVAAGVDSRVYTCAALQGLVYANGFVFISSPAFGDFVVANSSYCSGGSRVEVRSVPTTDRPECLVNYCIPANSMGTR